MNIPKLREEPPPRWPGLGPMMDRELEKAAAEGDVEFLKKAVAREPPEYFLGVSATARGHNLIFHIAAQEEKVEFMKEAMNILPRNILKQLLKKRAAYRDNTLLLHRMADSTNIWVIKCIREMYASFSWGDEDEDHLKPWLALTYDYKETPLNLALKKGGMDEECVMEILLMDPELTSCTIADMYGKTPLYYALNKEFNLVAEHILMSPLGPTCLVSHPDFPTLFTNHSDNVASLLKKCGYLDNEGNTPLHSALQQTSTQQLALETLSTYPGLCKICNNSGESPFFLAVERGYGKVVDEIMKIDEPRFEMLRRNDETTVLHNLSACPKETGQMLLKKFWWMINLRDGKGNTALDYAEQKKTDWLVNLLTNPSLIKNKQDFDWMEACEREERDAILAFIHNCQDLERVCRKGKDTLLHHVRLPAYEDYLYFLKIPSIAKLKNTTDDQGATPLHCALKRKDMHFAKALLSDKGVNRTVRDHYGCSSLDLLAELYGEYADWERMCKEIHLNPNIRTVYIQPGTNMEQMRNTLSVIAALLATITFAAGFTLPGGINSNNGEAFLGKKAAFIVFLLADAYAMCTSMLVLFCLVWSMVSDDLDMAQVLVDKSVLILTQSLYATLLAFMTGVYTVIEHSSLWAAIVIFVMCSIIGILANRTILYWVISLLISGADKEKQHQNQMLGQELLEVRTEG